MTDEQMNEIGEQVRIFIGDDRRFLLFVLDPSDTTGTDYTAVTNAQGKALLTMVDIINEDFKPQIHEQK